MCMCVCACVRACVRMCVHVYICMCACVRVYVCAFVSMCLCAYVNMYALLCGWMQRMHDSVHVYALLCVGAQVCVRLRHISTDNNVCILTDIMKCKSRYLSEVSYSSIQEHIHMFTLPSFLDTPLRTHRQTDRQTGRHTLLLLIPSRFLSRSLTQTYNDV